MTGARTPTTTATTSLETNTSELPIQEFIRRQRLRNDLITCSPNPSPRRRRRALSPPPPPSVIYNPPPTIPFLHLLPTLLLLFLLLSTLHHLLRPHLDSLRFRTATTIIPQPLHHHPTTSPSPPAPFLHIHHHHHAHALAANQSLTHLLTLHAPVSHTHIPALSAVRHATYPAARALAALEARLSSISGRNDTSITTSAAARRGVAGARDALRELQRASEGWAAEGGGLLVFSSGDGEGEGEGEGRGGDDGGRRDGVGAALVGGLRGLMMRGRGRGVLVDDGEEEGGWGSRALRDGTAAAAPAARRDRWWLKGWTTRPLKETREPPPPPPPPGKRRGDIVDWRLRTACQAAVFGQALDEVEERRGPAQLRLAEEVTRAVGRVDRAVLGVCRDVGEMLGRADLVCTDALTVLWREVAPQALASVTDIEGIWKARMEAAEAAEALTKDLEALMDEAKVQRDGIDVWMMLLEQVPGDSVEEKCRLKAPVLPRDT
ncbi:uncharacterized protein BKCO1_1000471 [Diplodia corticola]|uniref:Uncharacterized protein n=1 Tax=Diplodia corticola TaxID=236234 RepID=A0A1J9RKS6_9PEZI|nr:uncharacterized protein BKCO1_1000471 [Diplodia corticola]OJD40570.1 hypothetical protein BKCO1_1000471 [Diplodia corticola]